MRGAAWLVLILASGAVVMAAVPPNHAPTHRGGGHRFRPSQRDYTQSTQPPPKDLAPSESFDDPSPPPEKKKTNSAVSRLRKLLAPQAQVTERIPQATQVREERVEAASGPLAAGAHIEPLVHALPQLTLLLELLLHLLHKVVPPLGAAHHHLHQPYYPYHGLLHPQGGHLLPGGHHGGGHHVGHLGGHHGGLLHPKNLGPYYGSSGLYGVSATNNVLGKGPFPAYKYEDNAKK